MYYFCILRHTEDIKLAVALLTAELKLLAGIDG